jgi:hypothetical protein
MRKQDVHPRSGCQPTQWSRAGRPKDLEAIAELEALLEEGGG